MQWGRDNRVKCRHLADAGSLISRCGLFVITTVWLAPRRDSGHVWLCSSASPRQPLDLYVGEVQSNFYEGKQLVGGFAWASSQPKQF